MPFPEAPGTLRHACQKCGGSCNISKIPLYREEDRAGVMKASKQLGIPVVLDATMMHGVDGRCVFLGADKLCRIHAEVGAEHKPRVCRQWPITAIRVGEAVRVGIDPCCFTHWSTWKTAPQIDPDQLSVSAVPVSPQEAAVEAQVVGLLSTPSMTVASALGALAGTGSGLPEGLVGRLIHAIRALPADQVAANPDVGPVLAEALTELAVAMQALDPDHPPAWPVWSEDVDAYAVDAVRRFVWLRIAPDAPGSVPVAVYALLGAVAAGLTAPTDPTHSTRLFAAWLRLLRAPAMWPLLLPDPLAMQRLLRGP